VEHNQMVVSYQLDLVLLSVVVAIIGSFTSLAITSGSHDVDHSRSWEVGFFLANGGLIMGTTIWSMHFTAMMAVQFPMLINYNIVETILSIVIAISVTAMGLFIVGNRRLGHLSIPGAGVFMGLGIASMHYLGMGAIRGCGLGYDPILVAASGCYRDRRLRCCALVCVLQAEYCDDSSRRGRAGTGDCLHALYCHGRHVFRSSRRTGRSHNSTIHPELACSHDRRRHRCGMRRQPGIARVHVLAANKSRLG
jgi:NO-binding membrane sensor protein with MHYT domain